MRWLIDGYNVMHGGGRLAAKLSREGFRRARRRFLDELALAVGPFTAPEMTVVFDASVPPGDFPPISTYRGLSVVFALGDENADARIETLIHEHSNPKSLTVVSSDNRIRLAASRRRCRSLSADQFWELLDSLRENRARKRTPQAAAPEVATTAEKPESLNDEVSHWLSVFRELNESPEIRRAFAPDQRLLTDADIEEIQREIEREP